MIFYAVTYCIAVTKKEDDDIANMRGGKPYQKNDKVFFAYVSSWTNQITNSFILTMKGIVSSIPFLVCMVHTRELSLFRCCSLFCFLLVYELSMLHCFAGIVCQTSKCSSDYDVMTGRTTSELCLTSNKRMTTKVSYFHHHQQHFV